MKQTLVPRHLFTRILPAALFGIVGPLEIRAQSYAINWFTIDGGGGTSAGGKFSVTGTIGQPDAGTLTGGAYTLRGGFWGALVPIQVEGAPVLTITAGTGEAILFWAPAAPGWILQSTDGLSSDNWSNAPSGAINPVAIPHFPATRFFRLHKP